MRALPLTKGKYALVSDEDYERAAQFKWTALLCSDGHNWYAYRKSTAGNKRKNVYLHRFLLDEPDGMVVDHINGNGLDCRRENMRLATQTQNTWNRTKHISTKRRFIGVHRDHNKFQVFVWRESSRLYLGSYPTDELAAQVYDAAVIRLRGEFARTNFPNLSNDADAMAATRLAEKGIST